MIEVTDIKGIGPSKADTLAEAGFESVEDIAQADPDALAGVNGVGDDRALEFMVLAGDLLDAEQEVEDETNDGEEFDLTPSEVSDELEDKDEDEPEIEVVDEEEDEEEEEEEAEEEPEDETYSVTISFAEKLEYDVYHAALMRHHENVYTSYQPASDAMQGFLDELTDLESVSYELTEFELNTLHTAVKQARSDYQGSNHIDHMDALKNVEKQIDDARREHLF